MCKKMIIAALALCSCFSALGTEITITANTPRPSPAEMGCGVHSLFAACKFYKLSHSLTDVVDAVGAKTEIVNFAMLKEGAGKLGLECEALSLSYEELATIIHGSLRLAIVHIEENHFVLVEALSVDKETVLIYDFPSHVKLSKSDFVERFRGSALILSNKPFKLNSVITPENILEEKRFRRFLLYLVPFLFLAYFAGYVTKNFTRKCKPEFPKKDQ